MKINITFVNETNHTLLFSTENSELGLCKSFVNLFMDNNTLHHNQKFVVTASNVVPKKRGWKKLTFGENDNSGTMVLKKISGREVSSAGISAICFNEKAFLDKHFGINVTNLKPLWLKIEPVIV